MSKSHCRRLAAALLLVLTAAEPGLMAQATPPAVKPAPSAPEPAADPRWDINIVEGVLRVPGDAKVLPATLGNIVDSLRKRFPANVVLAPGVSQIEVNDLKLAAFQWEPGLEALRVASGNAFNWRRQPAGQPAGIDPATGLPMASPEPSESDFYALTPDELGGEASKRPPAVEVFNLAGWRIGSPQEIADKKTADSEADEKRESMQVIIRQTLDELQERPVQTRFHSGANLLVVTGPPRSVEIAGKLLLAIPGVVSSRAQEIRTPEPRSEPDVRETMLRRYGLFPSSGAPAQTPKAAVNEAEARERFMKRYGLTPDQVQPQPGKAPPGAPQQNPK